MTTGTAGRDTADGMRVPSADRFPLAGEAAVAEPQTGPLPDPVRSPPPRPRRRLVSRQWARLLLLAVVCTGLGAAGGHVVAVVSAPQYAAHAQVVYALTREQPTGFLREDRNISTQLVLLESRAVLEPVAARSGTSVEELAEAVSATVVDESEIIDVQVVDGDPNRARELLGRIVEQYLLVANADARSAVQDYLDGELATVLERMEAVRGGPPEGQGELPPLVEREQWLRTQLDELRMTDLVGPGATELVAPYVDPTPVGPRPLTAAAAGALTGLVVALLAAAVLARRMTRPDRPGP